MKGQEYESRIKASQFKTQKDATTLMKPADYRV